MAIQQQIQELARQIAELSLQFEKNNPSPKGQNINYLQLTSLAKKRQFGKHIVSEKDEYIKQIYIQTLFYLMNQSKEANEELLLLGACIANSMGELENIEQHVTKTLFFTEEKFDDFLSIMQDKQLKTSFIIDSLMINGIYKDDKLMQSTIDVLGLLQISEVHFVEYCKFTQKILRKDYINIMKQFNSMPILKVSSFHYMEWIFKEVLIENEKEPCVLSNIIYPGITKKVIVKNSVILFDSKDSMLESTVGFQNTDEKLDKDICVITNLEELYLENCSIKSEKLAMSFYQIKRIIMKNIDVEQCKELYCFDFYEAELVLIDNMILKDKVICNGRKAFMKIFNCEEFIFKNNSFINNQYRYRVLFSSTAVPRHYFIECFKTSIIKEENNSMENNEIVSMNIPFQTRIIKKRKFEHLIKNN